MTPKPSEGETENGGFPFWVRRSELCKLCDEPIGKHKPPRSYDIFCPNPKDDRTITFRAYKWNRRKP